MFIFLVSSFVGFGFLTGGFALAVLTIQCPPLLMFEALYLGLGYMWTMRFLREIRNVDPLVAAINAQPEGWQLVVAQEFDDAADALTAEGRVVGVADLHARAAVLRSLYVPLTTSLD